jgi:hypothetical protein
MSEVNIMCGYESNLVGSGADISIHGKPLWIESGEWDMITIGSNDTLLTREAEWNIVNNETK